LKLLLWPWVICINLTQCAQLEDVQLEDLVNILGGTDSRYDISHGGTLPLITRPWAFNSYAPQTDDDSNWKGWWFHPSDRRFFGIRVTHQPSPWIQDYGNFLIKAFIPSSFSTSTSRDKFTGYSPTKSTFSPYYFKTNLLAYGTATESCTLEFTASNHGGIMRVSFPSHVEAENNEIPGFRQTRRIQIVLNGDGDYSYVGRSPIDGTSMIGGYTKANSGGVGTADADFAHYFVALIYGGSDGSIPTSFSVENVKADDNSAWIDFEGENPNHRILTVRFATSFISAAQAMVNLQSEVALETITFDSLVEESRLQWREVLGRVKVHPIRHEEMGYTIAEAASIRRVFYSSMYRASIFPRQLTEYDADGNAFHWSPYAANSTVRVMEGPLSTDSGFWDAWNTVYPLLTLTNRPVLGEMINGWLNAYKEGGWLPKWASPGYRGSMVGTMGDVSLADAIVKQIPGFDEQLAYEAIRKDAFEVPPKFVEGVGRACLESYLQYGYIPQGSSTTTGGTCEEVVSRTLNYMQSDYAIAQAALQLGYKGDANTLLARAYNYSLIFDSKKGFFRSKTVSPTSPRMAVWSEPFDEFAWGGDYTEGGPWQFRFYVPHDMEGLASLYSSSGLDLCSELDKALDSNNPSTFHVGAYNNEIHEQTEMPDHCWGQYAHNNQPVHHMLYMYMYNGHASACASKGQSWIRKTLLELYKPTADMFPGDEDNGEMAAWFVLSSLGLYSLSPGSEGYVLGSPLFERAEIDISDDAVPLGSSGKKRSGHIGSSPKLLIVAHNNKKENMYVQSVSWNGETLPRGVKSVSYNALKEGGLLEFFMSDTPFYSS